MYLEPFSGDVTNKNLVKRIQIVESNALVLLLNLKKIKSASIYTAIQNLPPVAQKWLCCCTRYKREHYISIFIYLLLNIGSKFVW